MKSLYLRIYITLVVVLLAFALGSAWLFQGRMEEERGNFEAAASERLAAMAVLVQRALPPASAPAEQQALVLRDWGHRLRMPMALENDKGQRIAETAIFERREDLPMTRIQRVALDDGRFLLFLRFPRPQQAQRQEARGPGGEANPGGPGGQGGGERGPRGGFIDGGGPGPGPGMRPGPNGPREEPGWLPFNLLPRPSGEMLVTLLVLLFLGVAAGAYPVVRRLTRRLETLKAGVEQFGAGQLSHRVNDSGKDEVAALAASFNQAAERIETLMRSQKSLLANASHELRSPLARMKMAFSMMDEAQPAQRERLAKEIHTNIAELDALVEEVLLASRLEGGAQSLRPESVDLVGMAAEESARADAELAVEPGLESLQFKGEERLLRRALRNLLENARRYGGPEVLVELRRRAGWLELSVSDRGPGVPEAQRERIFEAFYRLPGHAEMSGGVGLGLNLVKQIALAHQGSVRCEAREGGGSRFVLSLPLAQG